MNNKYICQFNNTLSSLTVTSKAGQPLKYTAGGQGYDKQGYLMAKLAIHLLDQTALQTAYNNGVKGVKMYKGQFYITSEGSFETIAKLLEFCGYEITEFGQNLVLIEKK